MDKYPQVEINLDGILKNAKKIISFANSKKIEITGVVKASDSYENSYLEIANRMIEAGASSVADSRMNTIKRLREKGFAGEILLLRIAMQSEIEDLVKYVDISNNSELETIKMINDEALKQGKVHKVVLMMDLGDLREGYFFTEEIVSDAKYIEENLKGIYLQGIATNLGCFGSIKPSIENLNKLVEIARDIENEVGRKLKWVSGGATTSLPLLFAGEMPSGITHLRCGEGIIQARDLAMNWGVDYFKCFEDGLELGNYLLKAEIIELKEKDSYPIGEIFRDAFGKKPVYTNKGKRIRALLAVGKRDIGDHDALWPRLEGITMEGGSSDHLIIDVTDVKEKLKIGDILEFEMDYVPMMYSVDSSSVNKKYVYR